MHDAFEELKVIKSKLVKEEKSTKKIEDKKDREVRLKNEFLDYMNNSGVEKK